MQKITVKNSGMSQLQLFDDTPDGNLYIGEIDKLLPVNIKRFYFINNLSKSKSTRGKHAHRKLEQYIFCINGKFALSLDDGKTKQEIIMKDPKVGIRLGPMLWHTMSKFSRDCVILVIANDYYKEKDYIRDYKEFIALTKKNKRENTIQRLQKTVSRK